MEFILKTRNFKKSVNMLSDCSIEAKKHITEAGLTARTFDSDFVVYHSTIGKIGYVGFNGKIYNVNRKLFKRTDIQANDYIR